MGSGPKGSQCTTLLPCPSQMMTGEETRSVVVMVLAGSLGALVGGFLTHLWFALVLRAAYRAGLEGAHRVRLTGPPSAEQAARRR